MKATNTLPLIGMIVPPAHGEVPVEPQALYSDRARFIARGLALQALTEEGYDGVIDRVIDLACELRDAGAQAISLMGTSLSFYRGEAFNRDLIARMQDVTGLPATTMTDAVIDGLHAVGARRIAVATAYGTSVNRLLSVYLEKAGFEIASLASLQLTDLEVVQAMGEEELIALGDESLAAAEGDVDALFISCGGLKTLPVNPVLEARHGLPVISSALAGAWGAMRCAGLDPRAQGAGQLFAIDG